MLRVCPVCGEAGQNSTKRLFRVNKYWIVRCKCSLHECAEIIPTYHHVNSVYDANYFNGGKGGYADYLKQEGVLIERGYWYAQLLSKYMSAGKVLDVGSAAGFTLKGFVDSGWQAIGIEPNIEMAKYARKKYGLDVVASTLEDFNRSDRFDCILLLQVIAHFYDLRKAILRATGLSKPGGFLLVETWNRSSWMARVFGKYWHEYNPPSVLHYFSSGSLHRLLEQFGYHKVAQGRPSKWIKGFEVKAIMKRLFFERKSGQPIVRLLHLIPDGLLFPYPGDDLLWYLYQSKARMWPLRHNLPVSYGIREIDPDQKYDVATIARLHLQLLWWGPIAQLGELFLRQVCYTVLVRKGLMRGALFEVDGKPAGFIAYTDRSVTFHRTAFGQHIGYAAYWTLVSVIRDPRIVLRLWGVLRLMFSRSKEKEVREDPLAEIVAMGVLPEYRTPAFLRRTGLRISEELVKHAVKHFREVGMSKMRMIVDSDNKPTLLFYHSLGCSLEKYQHAGRSSVQFWLNLDQEPSI